jgi:hypothetical protein
MVKKEKATKNEKSFFPSSKLKGEEMSYLPLTMYSIVTVIA